MLKCYHKVKIKYSITSQIRHAWDQAPAINLKMLDFLKLVQQLVTEQSGHGGSKTAAAGPRAAATHGAVARGGE